MSDERFENKNAFTDRDDHAPSENTTAGSSSDGFRTSWTEASADSFGTAGTSSSADSFGTAGTSSSADSFGTTGAGTSAGMAGTGSFNGAGNGSSTGTGNGSGRFYNYGDNTSHRTAGAAGRSSANAPRGRKDREKPGKWVAMALAVILVFVLGAGAGAYISGRNATAALSGDTKTTESRSGSDAQAETGKKEAEDSADSEQAAEDTDKADSGSSQGTIARVQDQETIADTSVADIAEKVMPAIVSVYNKYTEKGQFFGRTYTQEGESAGSGIIIEETDGELLIVTNNHVVEGADSLSVQFIDEENCEAALKGTDASSDLAVIAVSLDDLSASTKDAIAVAELGDSDSLRIGEHAVAIGNALGYGQSLTVGYISALNREITSEDGITGTFIQTDAAINPGNSGGALLNSRGQVIGINSSKIGGSSVEGMGFAIPITKALPIIDNLKSQESRTKVAEEEQGVIGIRGISVTSDVASAYGLQVGAYVEEIVEGSGAADSDLEEGDIITAINGQTVTGMQDLSAQLAYYKVGTEVTLTVQHPGDGNKYEEKEIKVTLSPRSTFDASDSSQDGWQDQQNQQAPGQGSEDNDFFGFPFGSFGF